MALGAGISSFGCRTAPSWQEAPLAPPIVFAEPVTPQSVVILVLDAHSGHPLSTARAIVAAARIAPAADSLGRIRLPSLPVGSYALRIVALGYDPWRSTVAVTNGAGVALVVQLQRAAQPIQQGIGLPDTLPQLPHER